MHFKRNIIGLSTVVIVVLLLATLTYQQSATSSFPDLAAALTRGVRAGSTRKSTKPLKPSAAASTSSSAAVTPLSLPAYGFKISYPTSWQAKQEPGEGATNIYLTSESDSFFMAVTLAKNTGTSVKLTELVNATVAAIPKETQFKVVKTENGKLAGSSTKVLTVTQKGDNGALFKGQQIFLIKGKTLCVFFFTNTPDKYDQALQLFNSTLKTVTLR